MEDQKGANPKQKAHLGLRAPTVPGKDGFSYGLSPEYQYDGSLSLEAKAA